MRLSRWNEPYCCAHGQASQWLCPGKPRTGSTELDLQLDELFVLLGKPLNGSARVSLALALPNLICNLMSCLCFRCWILHHELKKTSSPLVACEHQCVKHELGLQVVAGCEAHCVEVVTLVSDVF